MAFAKTHLDEIINYPQKVISSLYENQNFVSLLLNIPKADLSNPEIRNAYLKHMLDYKYVDGTILPAESFCWVDTEIFFKNATTKTIKIDILVGVHKKVLENPLSFEVFGNRRDNLIREIDYTLRGNNGFGIGGLEPVDRISPVTFAEEFSGKKISFIVSNFANAKDIIR